MHQARYNSSMTRPYGIAVPAEPDELFPAGLKAAYRRLEHIANTSGHDGPSPEMMAWAKKVLLRVLPRHYLLSAEIEHFDREIHVNWEHGDKRVTVFLPAPDQVKIYYERASDQGTEHHLSPHANNPWEISGVLRWLFSPDA
jgi:hypothetical protein